MWKTFGLFAGVEACEKLKAGGFEHKGFISVFFPYLSVALLFFMCSERFFIPSFVSQKANRKKNVRRFGLQSEMAKRKKNALK